jgi:hypothetical protein
MVEGWYALCDVICLHVSQGGGKIQARSAPTRHELLIFRHIHIISSLEPECTCGSKILYLVLLKFIEYVQATFSPLLLLPSGKDGQGFGQWLVV